MCWHGNSSSIRYNPLHQILKVWRLFGSVSHDLPDYDKSITWSTCNCYKAFTCLNFRIPAKFAQFKVFIMNKKGKYV